MMTNTCYMHRTQAELAIDMPNIDKYTAGAAGNASA